MREPRPNTRPIATAILPITAPVYAAAPNEAATANCSKPTVAPINSPIVAPFPKVAKVPTRVDAVATAV